MSEFKYTDRIEAYLEGRLKGEERSRFESELEVDAGLRAEYDAFVAAERAMGLMGFRAMLERAGESAPTELPAKRKWLRWIVPAAVLWVALLAWLLFFQKKEKTVPIPTAPVSQDTIKVEEQPANTPPDTVLKPNTPPATLRNEGNPISPRSIALAKSMYEPVSFAGLRGGTSQVAADYLMQAAVAFDSSQFKKAMELVGGYKKGDMKYWQALEIRSHAAFNLGQYHTAAMGFRELAANTGETGKRTEGYLLLSLLADGQSDGVEFKALLAKIKKEGEWHPFYEKTLQLSQ